MVLVARIGFTSIFALAYGQDAPQEVCGADAVVGSCHVFGCHASHGPTLCMNGQCVCPNTCCSVDGDTCQTCNKETEGTCALFGCSASRGPTTCSAGHTCECAEGFCAGDGQTCTAAPWATPEQIEVALAEHATKWSIEGMAMGAMGATAFSASAFLLVQRRRKDLSPGAEPLLLA